MFPPCVLKKRFWGHLSLVVTTTTTITPSVHFQVLCVVVFSVFECRVSNRGAGVVGSDGRGVASPFLLPPPTCPPPPSSNNTTTTICCCSCATKRVCLATRSPLVIQTASSNWGPPVRGAPPTPMPLPLLFRCCSFWGSVFDRSCRDVEKLAYSGAFSH